MVTYPVTTLVAGLLLAFALLNLGPIFLEAKLLSIIGGSSNADPTIHRFSAGFQFLAAFAINMPLIWNVARKLVIYRNWKSGDSPACPQCAGPMMQRIAKRGNFEGQRFWGCTTFPKCTGKEHIGW